MRRGLKISWFITSALFGAVLCLAPSCGGTGDGASTEGAGASAGTASTGTTSSTGGAGCTPGESKACACENGAMGAQTCKPDGSGFTLCECSGEAVCGNQVVEMGEDCDDGNTEPNDGCNLCESTLCGNDVEDPGECGPEGTCQVDCDKCGNGVEDTNECGPSGSCPEDCCLPANTEIFAGYVEQLSGPVWSYQGLIGLQAGTEMCKAAPFAADHVCTYAEMKEAEAQGEFVGKVPAGTTAWVHRTTDEMVNGQNSPPGPGGRCNDWKYATNHISDGEFAVFDANGVGTYSLDNDTVFDANMPGAHTLSGQLECGGQMRAIFCCFQECVKPPPNP